MFYGIDGASTWHRKGRVRCSWKKLGSEGKERLSFIHLVPCPSICPRLYLGITFVTNLKLFVIMTFVRSTLLKVNYKFVRIRGSLQRP